MNSTIVPSTHLKLHRATLGSLFLAAVLGCGKSGPDLAPVGGQITLDGVPLKDTDIMFQPEGNNKSPSVARTDQEGHYVLGYKRGIEGGTIGWNTIRITTVTAITHGRQLVPARYNTQSDLRREVKPGPNVLDFQLTTADKN